MGTIKKKRLLALSLLLLLYCCMTEKDSIMETPNDSRTRIVARLDPSLDCTKTVLSSDLKVFWEKGDKIRVYSVSGDVSGSWLGNSVLIDDCYAGTTEACFDFHYGLTSTSLYATYPSFDEYKGTTGKLIDENLVITLPLSQRQQFKKDSFSSGANVAVAKEEKESCVLVFRNICGLLALQLIGNATIVRIDVTSSNGELLYGDVSIDLSYEPDLGPQISFIGDNGGDQLVLDCGDGVTLSETTPTKFYIVVPPGRLSGGFKANIWDSEGRAMTLTGAVSPKNEIKRATITTMPLVVYKPDTIERDLTASSITITQAGANALIPILSGNNRGWKVFWGDGEAGLYYEGLFHSYCDDGQHQIVIEAPGAKSISFDNLIGIQVVDLRSFEP